MYTHVQNNYKLWEEGNLLIVFVSIAYIVFPSLHLQQLNDKTRR